MTQKDDDNIVRLPIPAPPPGADEQARADTQRAQRLFKWADQVLKRLGLVRAVAHARSIQELLAVTFDADSAEVALAIRDALFPASGRKEEHFRGLPAGGLKLILKNRFAELRKTREAALRKGRGHQPDWTDDLILNDAGDVIANLANLILILTEAPAWKGVLGYDEFKARVVIRKRASQLKQAPVDTPWSDHYERQTRVWFQKQSLNPGLGDVGRAVQEAALNNRFHPVRDYFNALQWDGRPRLTSWLQDYFHAEDSPYVQAIGPRWLIQAVARIDKPGVKADHILVLEGPQGKQKSTALRILAIKDDWFSDRLSHLGSKDASLELFGILIIEIAELDPLLKTSSSASKSFITRQNDRYRPPYGRHVIDQPRQVSMAGTINPPADGYLKDPTGSRRIWPVACKGTVDCAGLKTGRDQLWAEAVHQYKARMPWWLETPELEALATAEQDKRFVVDAWEEPIREWLGDCLDVSIWDVLKHGVGLAPEQRTKQAAQKRVVSILTQRLGFIKRRPRTGEGREHRYQRFPPAKDDRGTG